MLTHVKFFAHKIKIPVLPSAKFKSAMNHNRNEKSIAIAQKLCCNRRNLQLYCRKKVMTGFSCEPEYLFRLQIKPLRLGEQLSVLSQNIIVQNKTDGFVKIKQGQLFSEFSAFFSVPDRPEEPRFESLICRLPLRKSFVFKNL